jgi:heme/copper-type cytochrome/quinol oxidase subunit 2
MKIDSMNIFAIIFTVLYTVLVFLTLVFFCIFCWLLFQERRARKETEKSDAESNSITSNNMPYGERAG